ncbi:MAG: OB-fold nucleic acid binding domain-containing protein [Nitrososphaerales archaeon]
MKISELKSGMRSVNVEASVVSVSEPRTVNKRDGGTAKVADVIIEDESGQIKLSLWEEQIGKVKAGSKIRIENGYTSSFKGENQLNVGRYGKLDIIEY